jgi:hypothetical protein
MADGVYYSSLDFFASCEDFLCCVPRQFVRICISRSEQSQDCGPGLSGDLVAVRAGHFVQQAVAAQQA